jgi:PmbA protein
MRNNREFSEKLLDRAMKNGADMAEVYLEASRTLSADAKGGEVESIETTAGFGYGLRVIRDRRLGFSYSTDRNEMERAVMTALESAGYTERDEFLDLPEPEKPETPEVYDPAIESINEKETIERARLIEKSSLAEDARVKKIRKASASFSSRETCILNSKGVSYVYPSTSCSAQIISVAEESGDSQMGWDFEAGRFLSDISSERVGARAARRALGMLGARRMNASKSPVLLDSLVGAEFLSVFASMLSSEAVQKGRSLLKGRVGEKVISYIVDVVDDGLMAHVSGTRHIDDEGVPVSRNVLVKGGVLQNFMYNTRTAGKEGTRSTGNAVRGGFGSVPSVGPINLYISPSDRSNGRKGFEDMIKSMQEGLYVMDAMGVHTINRISGEFSIGVSGLWIGEGEEKYPVKEAVISGNLLEFFGDVEAVSDDLRFYGSIGSPSLLFGPVDISA